MPYLVCVVPVCPVRAEASHRSEQVSQLLFGELCEVLERTDDFVKVRVVYDKYEGWCQSSQVEEMASEEVDFKKQQITADWVNEIMVNDRLMHIPYGSTLPESGLIGRHNFIYNGAFVEVERNDFSEELLKKIAFTFLNTPYLWGGRSVFGIDCSGFTQMVFKCMNVFLLRDASQQVTQGDEVGFLPEVKPGDLAFFDNEAGKITHVGILLNSNTIIHSAGRVRIDTIDNFGIVNSDTGKRTHKLRLIKRISTASQQTLLF